MHAQFSSECSQTSSFGCKEPVLVKPFKWNLTIWNLIYYSTTVAVIKFYERHNFYIVLKLFVLSNVYFSNQNNSSLHRYLKNITVLNCIFVTWTICVIVQKNIFYHRFWTNITSYLRLKWKSDTWKPTPPS